MLQNELRQKEAAREREELSRRIEENQRLDSQEAQANLMGRLQYQQDLVDQMAYNSSAREAQRRLEDQEFMLAQQAEREYQVGDQLLSFFLSFSSIYFCISHFIKLNF